jgi:hypothetical protein
LIKNPIFNEFCWIEFFGLSQTPGITTN